MCRALTVVCCALDDAALQTLKRAIVSTDWELAPGATGAEEAFEQIEDHRAHILVVWGDFPELIREARERFPALRIVLIGPELAEADVTVASVEEAKGAILGSPPVGGPVRS